CARTRGVIIMYFDNW
nr:immunoglobulin heavy chain junction region [Macaca mulatta]MOV41709.1 immunoglobulin heavy chain junction region [Macaca mulatta]MOV42065.1 immunoglobulin heavy chain junction region [Macaca mulatta]MOV42897.1 immunoglobulin heavy chain junction region [Macaca mulatta]MOV44815.1 immunoglobulin heavy chain junction region [Macaca mulatta]